MINVKLHVKISNELPENTITLPSKIYYEYIKNKDKFIATRLPAYSYAHVQLLSNFNILESLSIKENECEISKNISNVMRLYDYDDKLHIIEKCRGVL